MNECASLSAAHQSSLVLSVLVHHLQQQVMFPVSFFQLTTAAEGCLSQTNSKLISREQPAAPFAHRPPVQVCCGVAVARKSGVARHAAAAASTSCPGPLGGRGGGAAPLGAVGGDPSHPPSLGWGHTDRLHVRHRTLHLDISLTG